MSCNDVAVERREMAQWSFPLVCDLVRSRYGEARSQFQSKVLDISFIHSHLWRARILADEPAARCAQDQLRESIRQLGLSPHLVAEVDEEILDELMEVVIQRFHRSPLKASACSHILLHIARTLDYMPEPLAAA